MNFRTINKIILSIFISLSKPIYADSLLEHYTGEISSPSFELKSIDGKMHCLSDYRGKVVLVNFWASWCPPCLHEMPSIQRLKEHFSHSDFLVTAINVAEQKNKVIYQSQHFNKTLKVLLDSKSNTFKQWQTKILPTSFIIDKKGQIRYFVQGPIEWDSDDVLVIIEKLLTE